MANNAIRTTIVIALMLIGSGSYAEEQWLTSKLTRVYPLSNGNYVITVATDHIACTSTSDPDYYYVTIGKNGMTAEGSQKIYSAALAALAAGLDVSINFSDDDSACFVNRIFVRAAN